MNIHVKKSFYFRPFLLRRFSLSVLVRETAMKLATVRRTNMKQEFWHSRRRAKIGWNQMIKPGASLQWSATTYLEDQDYVVRLKSAIFFLSCNYSALAVPENGL